MSPSILDDVAAIVVSHGASSKSYLLTSLYRDFGLSSANSRTALRILADHGRIERRVADNGHVTLWARAGNTAALRPSPQQKAQTMSTLSDDDATASGTIIAHGRVSISTLNEMLPDWRGPRLSSTVDRLCELGLVERGMFRPKHGRSTILYSATAR